MRVEGGEGGRGDGGGSPSPRDAGLDILDYCRKESDDGERASKVGASTSIKAMSATAVPATPPPPTHRRRNTMGDIFRLSSILYVHAPPARGAAPVGRAAPRRATPPRPAPTASILHAEEKQKESQMHVKKQAASGDEHIKFEAVACHQ